MSANPPFPAEAHRPGPARLRWIVIGATAVLAIALAIAIPLATTSSPSTTGGTGYTSFAAGERPAPNFTLRDEHGAAFTLASLRGRPVIVTFIDPYCRDFCPREAQILTEAAARLGGSGPAIVSVSVNPWGDSAANFATDKAHWKLGSNWRWGTGTYARLASVWKGYAVGVTVTKKTIAGVTLRKIVHTGAAYVIDAAGDERALLVYPFTTDDVVSAARQASG